MLRNLVIILLSVFFITFQCEAKNLKGKKKYTYVAPPQTSLVVDARTGAVLHAEKAHHKIHPASLVKVMTLYLAFDAIEKGKISMDTMLPVSKRAQNQEPSKLGVVSGQRISMRDAISALTVKSANDVAVVVAEALGGTEEKFARLMTYKAKTLGMNDTNFTNASGLPHSKQTSTAVDLAKLALAIKRDYPQYYGLFRKTSFTYNGRVVHGHNRVLKNYVGAEGLKTGFHSKAGCNLLTTASRNGKSLVGVVIGGTSAKARDSKMVALLDKHFGVVPSQVRNNKFQTTTYKVKKKQSGIRVAGNYKVKKRSLSKSRSRV